MKTAQMRRPTAMKRGRLLKERDSVWERVFDLVRELDAADCLREWRMLDAPPELLVFVRRSA
jgi:hypothetical protein